MVKTNKMIKETNKISRSKQNKQKDPSISKLQLSLLSSGWMNEDRSNQLLPHRPIEVAKFAAHVDKLKKYEALLKMEFEVAIREETHSTRHALKADNDQKNSYKALLPYDYNRAVLGTLPGITDSDYINASYVDSILKPNAYIAAQGPNENTIADFWRMVWEQNSYVIVMLTKVFDFIRVMCVQYWPTEINQSESYGDLETILLSEEMLANFFIRTIRLRKGDEVRDIIQLHYNNWPSHTCPFSSSLLEFRRRVRIYTSSHPNAGPTIVHCSDGCGRTGTYLCIDANLELAEEDNVYDVFGYTKRLRQARKGMVENLDHYIFIHDTLEEAYICGNTWFPVTEISQQLKLKSLKNPITKQNEYQREYEKICKLASKLSIGDCAGGYRLENREKNRDITIVPPDNFRPYLTSFQSNDNTDYINAVFADGYTRPKEYIITEWPLQKTIADFWSLVYDHDCNSVVLLCNPPPCGSFPQFWPSEREKKRKYGPVFTVELISYNHYPNIKTWLFRISKKIVSLTELMSGVKPESKTTQLFQFTCWPAGHKVPTSTNALVELMNMVERWRQRTEYGPVIIMSANGKSRVGVYCAANVATEQVAQHGEVDVFQAAKTVRQHRPQLLENMMEYKYCYDVVLHYILQYLNQI